MEKEGVLEGSRDIVGMDGEGREEEEEERVETKEGVGLEEADTVINHTEIVTVALPLPPPTPTKLKEASAEALGKEEVEVWAECV